MTYTEEFARFELADPPCKSDPDAEVGKIIFHFLPWQLLDRHNIQSEGDFLQNIEAPLLPSL
jgi:hypothetical protein